MAIRVAIDIGGGFADLAAMNLEDGEMYWAKTYTTPEDLQRCVKEVFQRSQLQPESVDQLLHGHTLVINSILQRSGAKVGLITTRGFRDILSLQRANRRDIFNLKYKKPEPFVPRSLRLETDERVSATGEVLLEVQRESLVRAFETLLQRGVDAVAVCFINSYANPANELHSRELIETYLADHPDLRRPCLTISSDVCREWREYERTSTAAMNAYVMPLMERYVRELSGELRSLHIPGTLYMMLSNGGVASFEYAARRPIETVESGPVAGVVGAARLAEWVGERNLIALDGGSTTTKASLIQDLEIRYMSDYAVERDAHRPGYPIKVPVADVAEIGVGGNSLAWVDRLGELKVGPRNAGGTVGPAAYGRGGTEPTLTDAFISLGLMNPDYLLGGALPVHKSMADSAIGMIATRFGNSVFETASAIVRIAVSNAAQLLRLISVQRGYDPRDFCLLAYGGSGPMLSAMIARELEIPRVLVPAIPPGNFSAWGLLMSDLKHTALHTTIQRLSSAGIEDELEKAFLGLEQEVLALFCDEHVTKDINLVRLSDLRYYGQEHTIRVPVPSGKITRETLDVLSRSFHEEHGKEYGFTLDSSIELVNVVLSGTASVAKPTLKITAPKTSRARPFATRNVYWEGLGDITTPIFSRADLPIGAPLHGPAIVEETTTTIVLPVGFTATVDPYGNLMLREEGQ